MYHLKLVSKEVKNHLIQLKNFKMCVFFLYCILALLDSPKYKKAKIQCKKNPQLKIKKNFTF